MADGEGEGQATERAAVWFWRGVAQTASVPALILMAAMVGFAGLARDSGISLVHAMTMTLLIWALPSMLVLVGAIKAGVGLLPAAIAVALSAVRLMPMVMALYPILRDRRSSYWVLVPLSHFVAVTAWVFGMLRLPALPRPVRLPYYAGFGISLTLANTAVTGVAYVAAGAFPPVLNAGLTLLTPLYFTCAMWAAARLPADRLALLFGVMAQPVIHRVAPDYELIWVGLVGGTAAYAVGRVARRLKGGNRDA